MGREDGEVDNGVVRVKAESQSAVKIQTFRVDISN